MIVQCSFCNKDFNIKPYRLKKTVNLCCSRKCMGDLYKESFKAGSHPRLKYHSSLEAVLADRIKNIKARAKKKGIIFTITQDDLVQLFNEQNGLCYYTGIPLKVKTDNNRGHLEYNVLSVDRKDSVLGYTKDNVVLCCNSINALKGNSSVDQLEFLIGYIIASKNSCNVKIKKLRTNAVLPAKSHLGDAGYDLSAAFIEDLGDKIKVYTGIALQPEIGWYFEVFPRSSIYKKGLYLANSVGIIDNQYQGEIICVFNKLTDYQNITIGERIAQIILKKQSAVSFEENENWEKSERSDGGFGSSGQ